MQKILTVQEFQIVDGVTKILIRFALNEVIIEKREKGRYKGRIKINLGQARLLKDIFKDTNYIFSQPEATLKTLKWRIEKWYKEETKN